MAYIYQADVWCDACGEHIKAELARAGTIPEDTEDESSFDSDEYPKHYDTESEESDGPDNCADGKCGGFANGQAYGTFLENQLTREGYHYLKSMLDGHGAAVPKFGWCPKDALLCRAVSAAEKQRSTNQIGGE